MTVVLLVIPLVVMSGLYGNVIHSLKSGIKLEISSVEPPLAAGPAAGLKACSSHNLNSVLLGSSSLARATSCIALNQFLPPAPGAAHVDTPTLLQLPNTLDDFRLQTLQSLRRRSSGVLLPPKGVVVRLFRYPNLYGASVLYWTLVAFLVIK